MIIPSLGIMAYRIFQIVTGIKKDEFMTSKQGFVGMFLYAMLGIFCIYIGQDENVISQKLFSLGMGLTMIALFFLLAATGMGIKQHLKL